MYKRTEKFDEDMFKEILNKYFQNRKDWWWIEFDNVSIELEYEWGSGEFTPFFTLEEEPIEISKIGTVEDFMQILYYQITKPLSRKKMKFSEYDEKTDELMRMLDNYMEDIENEVSN